jgi:hypothetical protein
MLHANSPERDRWQEVPVPERLRFSFVLAAAALQPLVLAVRAAPNSGRPAFDWNKSIATELNRASRGFLAPSHVAA